MALPKKILFFFILTFVFSCKTEEQKQSFIAEEGKPVPIEYATGFSIIDYGDYKILTVNNPWPEAEKSYRYLLAKKNAEIPAGLQYDEKVTVPVEKIVVTSTTHISALEILNEEKSLIGFPGLDYISSEETRKRISEDKIMELGKNEAINTEILLSLQPDVVIGFAVDGNNKVFDIIRKNGIPIVYNADWMENSPLGKAEWIKFFGTFYNKTEEATVFFNEIVKDYEAAKKIAEKATSKPTVLAGSMFKDIWHLPAGNSWHAKFIKDANAQYLYEETEGSGSLSLSFETVFAKARNADFWIGPAQFQSYEQLLNASPHYIQFAAFQDKNIYTYSSLKGETGGVIFYEMAPNRPDLVLKDLISIFHPTLLPEYETTFYKVLE